MATTTQKKTQKARRPQPNQYEQLTNRLALVRRHLQTSDDPGTVRYYSLLLQQTEKELTKLLSRLYGYSL